jgi:hypothetical protein
LHRYPILGAKAGGNISHMIRSLFMDSIRVIRIDE